MHVWKMSPTLRAIALLSFSSGLPLLLVGSTLQAWYTVSGVGLHTIGLLTLVGMPYVYKFLWAPLLDRYQVSRFGRRVFWVRLMQILMIVSLVIMAFLNPSSSPSALAMLALCMAFFSATQDTAIDAYRTDMVDANQRATASAITNVSYRSAMIVAGALAMVLAGVWGWRFTYLLMAGIMLGLLLLTQRVPRSSPVIHEQSSWRSSITQPFQQFWKAHGRSHSLMWLVLIVLYKFSEALTLSLNTPFLIRHCGFSLIEVGAISKFVGIGATLLGSVLAGVLMPRLGLYRSLFWFGFCQTLASLGFMALAHLGHHIGVMVAVLSFDYLFGGLSGVAAVVLLMGLCDKRFSATQYALFSALSALPRVMIGPLAAWLVGLLGWFNFYGICLLLGAPALLLLWRLKKPISAVSSLKLDA